LTSLYSMVQNYRMILSYDGTDFHGWQRQLNKRTVQDTIEKALFKITKNKVAVIGAGRTDKGVHALAQVANFKTTLILKEEEFTRALNSTLPNDIRVISMEKVALDFHAREMALSKVYQYRIFNSPLITPFLMRYVLHWSAPLDLEKMKKAAELFIREDDFSGFSSNRFLNPVRRVTESKVEKRGDEIIYTIEANGFLRYMARTIVGTLLEIGRGKAEPEIIEEIFRKKERHLAGPTAPARGLCLIKVKY